MYDYTLHLQTKQRIEDLRRENRQRHWLRDALNSIQAERNELKARKARIAREHAGHE